ncbi:MAG: aminomethyltransferase family protein [Acidobacteria bacterium]|nr:aminomethyltransferase family protein [Acidobacteriota bacterium]
MTETAGHDLLRTGAALVTHADRGTVRVTGAERASWLQGLLSNDIEALTPGRGCYAAWLTPQGRMLTDAVVLAEDDTLTVTLPAPLVDALLRQLNAAIFAEDVLLTDESAEWRTLGVHGVRAAEVVARSLTGSRPSDAALTVEHLATWTEYTHAPLEPFGRIVGASPYGVPGFRLCVRADDADPWMSRLRLAGATLTPADELEFARIESGRPQFLVDMDADTIPLEAGIEDRAISFTKGCYVGQEVIVRIVHRGGGRVVRKLVGLVIDGECVPAARAGVKAEKGEIGRVTSSAWSPRLGAAVALAYVHRDSAEPGTAVRVACNGGEVAATVRAFPLA